MKSYEDIDTEINRVIASEIQPIINCSDDSKIEKAEVIITITITAHLLNAYIVYNREMKCL